MFARLLLGAVTAGVIVTPALAGMMTADEARRFVAGKIFAFTCFDGTRGAGRILDDMGAAGSIQFSGAGRYAMYGCRATRCRSVARACARRSRAFRSNLVSISTNGMIAASADRSRVWALPIAISAIRAAAIRC